MQRKDAERSAARRLRQEGKSIKAIAAELGVAVSSVSVWVRDVERGAPPAPEAPQPPPSGPVDEPVKHCPKCDRNLPIGRFNRAGDGRQHWCRDCFRAYFRARGQKHRDQSRASRERRREIAQEFLLRYLVAHACVDCGEDELMVLEFDHCRGEKVEDISRLLSLGAGLDRLESEVRRCDVVCANCHRRRSAARAGHFRATAFRPPRGAPCSDATTRTWSRSSSAAAASTAESAIRSCWTSITAATSAPA